MTGIRLADRMARLGTESAFEVLARARAIEDAGGKIIHLEIGEPDFPTAPHIVQAAVEALHAGATHYVPAPGIPPLRQAVAAFLERTGRMRVIPDRVVVTPGAKPIMFFSILALASEGDEVLYPDPGFPMYESITSFAGAVPVPVPLRESNDFRIDTDELERLITDRSRLLIINSPHNPCGSALTRQDCDAIAAIALRHDLIVLSDEVYWAIRYGQRSASPGGHSAPPGTPRTPGPGTPHCASRPAAGPAVVSRGRRGSAFSPEPTLGPLADRAIAAGAASAAVAGHRRKQTETWL
jgi:aspartate/methionine/tyrosine aminotransferase